jgi:hypothetical protein
MVRILWENQWIVSGAINGKRQGKSNKAQDRQEGKRSGPVRESFAGQKDQGRDIPAVGPSC